MIDVIFWTSLLVVVYSTIGYPVLIWLLAQVRSRPVTKRPVMATVTCVIAVRNEAHTIGEKITNLFSSDFPTDLLDVVVVSDGSVDETVAVVEAHTELAPGRLRVFALPESRGKAHALNVGIASARGDIIVFADARQRFHPDAIRSLLENFADPRVGAVSGELVLERPEPSPVTTGLRSYWNFEKLLRREESRSGSTIGCTGAIYAARRVLVAPLPSGTILDDVLIPMRIMQQGFRVVFEERALAVDRLSDSPRHEFTRKVRTIAGNIQLLQLVPGLLNPRRGTGAWRFVSHKLLPRVVLPYALVVLLASNLALHGTFYTSILLGQVGFYALGLVGLRKHARGGLFEVPAAFLVLNAASVVAAIRYLSGAGQDLWHESAGSSRPRPVALR